MLSPPHCTLPGFRVRLEVRREPERRRSLGVHTAVSPSLQVRGQEFPHTWSLGPLRSLGQEWGWLGGGLSLGIRGSNMLSLLARMVI